MEKKTQQHHKKRYLRHAETQLKRLWRFSKKYIKKPLTKRHFAVAAVVLGGLIIALLGLQPSREQKLCMDSFSGQFKHAKSIQFKKLTLCPDKLEDAGQIYIGTIATKNTTEPLDYACLIIKKNQAIVDFERAPAFFYLDSIADKMSPPAKKILCRDIQSLFQKYVQENCTTAKGG